MSEVIDLEGVRVHNLQIPALRIPHGKLTVICGVSGSGKSSLAFDTLFAEGQRRYIETFSANARQFLERIERPAADRIDGIPPAIAIRQHRQGDSPRSTVGTRTEIVDFLRLLFLRLGSLTCPRCGRTVRKWTALAAARHLLESFSERRCLIAFRPDLPPEVSPADAIGRFARDGYTRAISQQRTMRMGDAEPVREDAPAPELVVQDRVVLNHAAAARIQEALAAAMRAGRGRCVALVEHDEGECTLAQKIDDGWWLSETFSEHPRCEVCQLAVAEPEVEDLSFSSPRGACPECEGTGVLESLSLRRMVPDPAQTIRDGAIAPWSSARFRHLLDALLQVAESGTVRVDVPFEKLSPDELRRLHEGIPDSGFTGVAGFHRWLIAHRRSSHASTLLRRLRTRTTCPLCRGSRLNSAAETLRLKGHTLSDVCRLELGELSSWLRQVVADDEPAGGTESDMSRIIRHLNTRIDFLVECGLEYLSLDRSIGSLSGGESQRVMLTAALGSGLINTLYVLDEPTSGLHSADTQRIIAIVQRLRDPGNTVVVVEHDPAFILAADLVIEIGPGGGSSGGRVVFSGRPEDLQNVAESPTGQRIAAAIRTPGQPDRRTVVRAAATSPPAAAPAKPPGQRSDPEFRLSLQNVNCHNIRGLSVELPLHVLCAVTGPSGSGKSSLVIDSLYPHLAETLGQRTSGEREGTIEQLSGADRLQQVLLLDQQSLLRGSRSVPATWIGAFDEIRRLMADTHEAKKRNFGPGMFSFNSASGGRCSVCRGMGQVTIGMQFLADVSTVCEECQGRRFRSDVLEVRYRDRSISDILEMTGDEAFQFFQGQRRIQRRLNALRESGLGYLRLGQPLSTVSGGEAQRLRIAALIAGTPLDTDDLITSTRRTEQQKSPPSTLFLLDEPSTGLHLQDIDRLMLCLRHLVQTGNSVIIVEHDDYLIRQCDYEVRLGPGAGLKGGQVVKTGPLT